MVLRITVTPQGTKEAPLPPSGDAASPTEFGRFDDAPEDFAPELLRNLSERADLMTAAGALAQQGHDPQDALVAMHQAGTLGDNRVAQGTAESIMDWRKLRDMALGTAKDIAIGGTELPMQALGGARDAAQAAINGIGAIGDWLNANVADLDAMVGLPPKAGQKTTMPQLPTVGPAKSTTGGVIRSVAQFLTGFAGAGKVLGAAGKAESVGGALAASAGKGAIADFAAFDGHEKRLSDLIQSVPALRNPVNEFLSSKEGDTELDSRFKRAVEGLGLGAATEGLVLSLRAIRAARQAKAASEGQPVAAQAAEEAAKKPLPMNLLGDAADGAPLTARATAKASAASKATETGVPDDVAARALTEKGFVPLDAKRDVFVNWARINTDVDVKRVIQDVADAFKGDVDAARRGVRTNIETVADAAKVDAWETLLARRKGGTMNAEESVAVRQLWEASGRKLLEVAEKAATVPTPENLYQFRKMLATHYAVQNEVIATRTETARALQSWAIPAGGSKLQMQSIEDMLNKYGGAEANLEFARRVASLKNVPNGIGALDEIAQKGALGKSLDVFKEVWVNALLSGPKTHMVNMISNSAVAGLQMIERAGAARWSQTFGTGDLPIGEAAAQWFGLTHGIRDAFRNMAQSARTGQSGFGTGKVELPFERAIASGHLGLNPETWLGRGVDALGTVVNTPGRALTAADEFYKTIGYRMELHAQAFRTASREIADGKLARGDIKDRIADIVANPPDNIKLAAIDQAAYQTFTSSPGKWVQMLGRIDHELSHGSPAAQFGSLGMRILLPFRNTPANIMKFSFERTPLAPLMTRYRDSIAAGGAEADLARTRMALGTMTMAMAFDLASDGHITGSGPPKGSEHASERAALYRTGWRPYSVKIGDRYFAYNRIDPTGFMLGLGADIAEAVQNMDAADEHTSAEIQKAMFAAAMSAGNNVMSKSWFRGVGDLMQAMTGSERQGSNYVEKTVSSLFVPSIVNEVRTQIDPYMRETHDMVSKVKSRLPYLSRDLPLNRDLYGRPRSYESGLGQTFDTLSPIYSTKDNPEPIDTEILDQGISFGTPPRKIGDVKLAFKPAIYSRFLELQGQVKPSEMDAPKLVQKYGDLPLLQVLNGIVTGDHPLSAEYKQIEDADDKKKFFDKILQDYRRAARVQVVTENPKDFPDMEDWLAREGRRVGRGQAVEAMAPPGEKPRRKHRRKE
ncbi:MAG: hypothetical protein IT562_10885 [Alphaproteobacteria bacterium]|nr:hypothetical protein [Alphaproteobacteria bacterium]